MSETHGKAEEAAREGSAPVEPSQTPALTSWKKRLEALVRRLGGRDPDRTDYVSANAAMVRRAVQGFGPDSETIVSGARVVVNIPNVHVPAFCTASASSSDGQPYKNTYDLAMRAGDQPGAISMRRKIVDDSLPLSHPIEETYFGAMELNGAGVRFYGDFCLVLRRVADETPLLDRNSYDLIRSPLYDRILKRKRASVAKRLSGEVDPLKEPTEDQKMAMAIQARTISGHWIADRREVAAIKVLESRVAGMRRISTGQISDGILDDEDYIEILKHGSFRVADLEEVRVSAADGAAEARIADRSRFGPAPSGAAELWRDRRQAAEQALARGPALRIVTSRGRMK